MTNGPTTGSRAAMRPDAAAQETTMVTSAFRPHDARQSANAPETALPWSARMRSVLDDRVALLEELTAVSARQESVIAERDAATLLELLNARQRIVDRFLAGQHELLALTGDFESRVGELAVAEATELRARLRTLSEGLHRVTVRDEAAQSLLREARDEARTELMRSHTQQGARSAYGASTHRVGDDGTRYADRRV
jgi:hypothetical protein